MVFLSLAIDNMAILPYDISKFTEVVMKETDTFRIQAQLLRALANEARLKIVDRLSNGVRSVGQLTEFVGLDQSTVSKHLSLLKAHGIVRDRRDGNVVFYELLTPCVLNFFACATQVIKERAGR
jgi:ArsR family transcriptional regulator